MKERNWDDFVIEPRAEAWDRLEKELKVSKDLKLVKGNLKKQFLLAAASVVFVLGMGGFLSMSIPSSVKNTGILTETILMDQDRVSHFTTGRDIYFDFEKIEEGTSSGGLVVRKKNRI